MTEKKKPRKPAGPSAVRPEAPFFADDPAAGKTTVGFTLRTPIVDIPIGLTVSGEQRRLLGIMGRIALATLQEVVPPPKKDG